MIAWVGNAKGRLLPTGVAQMRCSIDGHYDNAAQSKSITTPELRGGKILDGAERGVEGTENMEERRGEGRGRLLRLRLDGPARHYLPLGRRK